MPTFRYDDDRELLELVDAELDRQEALDRAQDRAVDRADAPPFSVDEAWARRELLEVTRLELEAPDQLAAYRLPDGTLDVDALELGHPTPGYLRAPNYATGRGPEWIGFVLEVPLAPATAPALFIPVNPPAAPHRPSLREVELDAAASLEASRARRQERAGAGVAWTVGLVLLAVLAAAAVGLIVAGLVSAAT